MRIRAYADSDLDAVLSVWNEVVEEGIAFPQEEPLTPETGREFFAAQSYTGVAEDEDGQVVGIYILHPNNVGRCGHIANASYAVRASCRGRHIGEKLVTDCLAKAREIGFRVLQFNAVVESNRPARHLYERLGFVQLGVIPGGFRRKDGRYENICRLNDKTAPQAVRLQGGFCLSEAGSASLRGTGRDGKDIGTDFTAYQFIAGLQ